MPRTKAINALAIVSLVLLPFTLTVACSDAGDGFTEAEAPTEPPTHITAADLSEKLRADELPNINWVQWYMDGQSPDVFPLETRTPEEIAQERREKGRLLINGRRVPPGHLIRTEWDMKLYDARRRVLAKLSGEPMPEVRTR